MADIQSATAEIRRGKKKKKETTGQKAQTDGTKNRTVRSSLRVVTTAF